MNLTGDYIWGAEISLTENTDGLRPLSSAGVDTQAQTKQNYSKTSLSRESRCFCRVNTDKSMRMAYLLMVWTFFFNRIGMAVGRLLADAEVHDALAEGGYDMQAGIMRRCLDYDHNYRLRRLRLNPDQRAVAAMYIFSKEVQSAPYARLGAAVENYATEKGISPPFAKVDTHISWIGDRMAWTP
ncbi:hypothetical protein [Acidiphilium sp. 37-64-53]|uniref:hypothetical protein n=1 Tax=Acidiphilium sp. 37-64-53 TaxID=1970299 RepID=UPI0025797A05|nr:hypothetical protein [Acidiphilium sp. 37-64-53]